MIESIEQITFTRQSAKRSSNYLRYEIYGEPDADMECDFSIWVIRANGQLILFDTGFTASAAASRGQTITAPVMTALEEAGYSAHDVETIVLSHLHYDHIGNLEHFPQALVHVQRSEYEFWNGPLASRLQFAQLWEREYFDNLSLIEREGRLVLLDGDATLGEGISTVLLGGHTVGTQALILQAPGRRVVLASDAVHYVDELEKDMPFAVVADLPAMYRAFDTLNELARAGASVVPGHDIITASLYPSRLLPSGATVIDLLAEPRPTPREL